MPEQTVMSIVRVAVLADGKLTDVALPTELPLREIIPAVTRLLVSEDDTTATQQVTLAPIGGAPFSVDATLDRVGVADGDLLALQPVSAGPAAAGIVEDIADAAVIFSSSRQKPWGATQIRRGARLALMALVIALTALGVLDRATSGSPLGLYVVCALAVVTMVAALLLGRNAPGAATELSIVALFPVAAALAMVIPGNSLAAQVLLAAAGVTAWSLICLLVADRATAFFTTSA